MDQAAKLFITMTPCDLQPDRFKCNQARTTFLRLSDTITTDTINVFILYMLVGRLVSKLPEQTIVIQEYRAFR